MVDAWYSITYKNKGGHTFKAHGDAIGLIRGYPDSDSMLTFEIPQHPTRIASFSVRSADFGKLIVRAVRKLFQLRQGRTDNWFAEVGRLADRLEQSAFEIRAAIAAARIKASLSSKP